MSCVNFLLVLLFFVSLNYVQSEETCDFENVNCLKSGARENYDNIMTEINGFIHSIEPINIQAITGEINGLKYYLNNSTMAGIKNCDITKLQFASDSTYTYDLFCPKLFLHYNYIAKGPLGPLQIDGNGQITVTLNNYLTVLKGQYGNFISDIDQKSRIDLRGYEMEFKPEGNITFEVNNLVNGNKEKSDEAEVYVNKNSKKIEEHLRSTAIGKSMKMFVEKLNIYLETFPLEEIIPRN